MRWIAATLMLLFACAAAPAGVELPPAERFAPVTYPPPTFPSARFSVRDHGAIGDGAADDSAAVRRAIDACIAAGGGTVFFPPGTYTVASVRLRSNVRLLLDDAATIRGAATGYEVWERPSKRYQDGAHSFFRNAVLFGEEIENVAIEGGFIDGGGAKVSETGEGEGNKVISIRSGRNLSFKNLRHRSGAHILYLLNDCDTVTIDNIVVERLRDAINLVNSRNVAVSRCKFTGCMNDTIAFKSDYALGKIGAAENCYVWDCHFETDTNGIQFGSETIGDIRNVYCWDIMVNTGLRCGISVTSNDGGIVENVHFRNIRLRKVGTPIFISISRRLRTRADAKAGAIRDVTFDNIRATKIVSDKDNPAFAATFSGLPELRIERVRLHDVSITYKGNEDPSEASAVPDYPENQRPHEMGPRPASAFYVRHAADLLFDDVRIGYEQENAKPPFVFFDTHGLTMQRITMPKPAGIEPIRLHRVTDFHLRDSKGLADVTHKQIDMPMPRRPERHKPLLIAAGIVGIALFACWRWIARRRLNRKARFSNVSPLSPEGRGPG